MHTVLIDLISVLIVLGIMVLVHEFGHFLAAKLCGVRVEQFSIGFPPRLFGFKIGETDYCVSAIPLGGYVKMTGETLPGENMDVHGMSLDGGDKQAVIAGDPGALTSHPRWQRIIIGLAGPFANFALALALMTGFFMLHNEVPLYEEQPILVDWVVPNSPVANAGIQVKDTIVSYDGQESPTLQQFGAHTVLNLTSQNMGHAVPVTVLRNGQRISVTLDLNAVAQKVKSSPQDFDLVDLGLLPVMQPGPIQVSSVSGGTPAANAGIQTGDKFVSIDGHTFHGTPSLVEYLQERKGAPISVSLDRDGKLSTVVVEPHQDVDAKGSPAWRIGFTGTLPPSRVEQMPLPKALAASVKFNRENSLLILEVLKRVLTHKMAVSTLSGPIGIAQQTGMAAESHSVQLMIQVMTEISLNLGMLNLLPFPILDGGMILFLLIESVIRRDIDIMIKERVYQVAFVLIIVFFAYVMFNDISKLPFVNHIKL